MSVRACVIAILLAALSTRVCHAELLLYEGYNGYTNGVGGLDMVPPNSNTIGLNQSVNFSGSGPAAFTVNPTSVAFSPNYLSTGGSISMSGVGAAVLAATIDLQNPAPVGTLYASYLVNFGAHSTAGGEGTHTRIADNASTSGTRLQSYADSRTNSNVTTTGVAYGTSIIDSSQTLSINTSYLIISSFTNVNTALSGSTTGVGRLYALSAEQYDSFLLAGATESYLTTTAIGTGASQITSRVTSGTATSGTFAFDDGDFAHFVTVGHALALDEMRYGTTLSSVVAAIPEPSTIALTCFGFAYFFYRRAR